MSNLIPSSKNQTLVEDAIIQERLRQAKYSFNLALIATAISACVGLVGFGLLLSNKFSKGTVTTASGLASSACCIQFAKASNDRLDKILEEWSEFYKP
ncbi:hypothetical protein NDA01_28570 [Trichocoleus desertorum AS-A10]|uniref:TRADD-N-associated membrane domain-containing protein n=1 Tax=Trichocoleus desertorum TaxID=1481672 RepID=UPI00329742AB